MELNVNFADKKIIAGLIALICVIAIVFYLPSIVSMSEPEACFVGGVCQHEERVGLLTLMIPVFILIGIAIGALVFLFMTQRLESKTQDVEKLTRALIQFLNKDEKKIVEKIIEENGKIYQSELSRIEGIGKLKSHRIIRKLEDRRVIEIERHGKTNIIKLKKEIKDALLN
ncbi:MAG: hypothetical protein HOE11_01020 [Candidatus Diapherotrites archaeon]|jgi:hypothetical protein|nr:hypothetical protein [Candidatus Diapherotrites archaeon]MBT4596591.1 hypothetical protein [Candidatus Diapherotrites archaeon]